MNLPASRNLNTALIGYGFAGKTFHAPVLMHVPGIRLTHIVSSNAAKVAKDWPAVTVLGTAEEAFRIPEIDLIVIATPNTSHYPLAAAALSAGKHVVVDKPFTITAAEAAALLAQAAKAKLLISVFQSRRFDGEFLTLRKVLSSDRLGEVTYFESHYDRYRPVVRQRWREMPGPGSGIWYDLGSHLADEVLQLFGMPQAVFADLASERRGCETVDYFHVQFRYPRMRAIVHGSCLVARESPRFLVHGTLGSLVKFGIDPQEDALIRGEMPVGPDWGRDSRTATFFSRRGEAIESESVPMVPGNYCGYYQAIRDAIVGGGPNPVTARDALAVMTLLELGMKSSEERRELPFPEIGEPGSFRSANT